MRNVLSSFVTRFIYIYIYRVIIDNMEYLLRKGMIRTCELSYKVFRVLWKAGRFYLIEKKLYLLDFLGFI